jgi:hypothetical protein
VALLFSDFINFRKSETEREQPVLLALRPGTGKAEALAQPQHGLEPLEGAPRCVERLKAADPRHGPLDPEVVALDPLLQVLRDVMDGVRARRPPFLAAAMAGG